LCQFFYTLFTLFVRIYSPRAIVNRHLLICNILVGRVTDAQAIIKSRIMKANSWGAYRSPARKGQA
jgi:hypothetical protein